MSEESEQARLREDARLEAATWLVRFQSRGGDSATEPEFLHWLTRSDMNRNAWQAASHAWQGLQAARTDPIVARMRAAALHRDAQGRFPRRTWAIGGIAAACVAITLVAVLPAKWRETDHAHPRSAQAFQPRVLTTAVGERRTVSLQDGSAVTLDTHSEVQVTGWSAERRLRLVSGRAYFDVAKDEHRPFIVDVAHQQVTALGTTFDIRLDGDVTTVDLLRGRVLVKESGTSASDAQSIHLTAGNRLVAAADRRWEITPIEPSNALAWMRGETLFDNTPLSAAVAEMNRYSERQLTIRSPELSGIAVNGVFRSGDIDQFTAALQAYGLVTLERSADGISLLKASRGGSR